MTAQQSHDGRTSQPPRDERLLDWLPRSELERRWVETRAYMRREAIDALIVGGTSALANGHLRWFTGIPISAATRER